MAFAGSSDIRDTILRTIVDIGQDLSSTVLSSPQTYRLLPRTGPHVSAQPAFISRYLIHRSLDRPIRLLWVIAASS